MDLIPVYEDEEPSRVETGVVEIDPAFVQTIGVQSIPVERTDIPYTIRTMGTVAYNDKQLYFINTKFAGRLENVSVNYIGQPVEKKEVLFEIYSLELVTTQQEYLNALDYAERLGVSDLTDIRERARSLVEASRRRLLYWDITEDQIRGLERGRELRRTLRVVSPVDGLVVEKMDQALEGMYAKPGMNLYKIVDLPTVWVEAEVFEHQLPWLRSGQGAVVRFSAPPGSTFYGKIPYLYPAFNRTTRTARVSIELANPGRSLRADMYAEVTFEVPAARNVIAVPENAVIHSGERNIVVLDQGGGRFQVREVTLGRNGNRLWEVSAGVNEGERVVISSQFLIDSESNLREAIRKMLATRQADSRNSRNSRDSRDSHSPSDSRTSQLREPHA
jgi:Cu(I)/Ag(I) efflux system membrane fusion protein/cobalt-zinc-cadmium efflux system membrane fusion protein